MEIIADSDIYSPSEQDGVYVDKPVNFAMFTNGIRCPCCNRRDQIYQTASSLKAHFKTKSHIQWLENMNNNRNNHLTELTNVRSELVDAKRMIGQLQKQLDQQTNQYEKQIRSLTHTIHVLSLRCIETSSNESGECSVVNNLLDFD